MPDSESASQLPRPRTVGASRLGTLGDPGSASAADITITGVTASSGDVRPGDLFAALPGRTSHGIDHAPAAFARGAVAVLTDVEGSRRADGRWPGIVADSPRAALAGIAARVYGRPSQAVQVIGVTGTSGKTTTTFLVRAGLAAAGQSIALIGTVGTYLGPDEVPGGLTTPESPQLQALLAIAVEQGISHVVMEVSSHALRQHRVDDVDFALAAFTNLSQDHLDFHRDLPDYFEAKAMLFDGRAARSVVMVDDEWGRRLADRLGPTAVTVRTSPGPADWTMDELSTEPDGSTSFRAHGPSGSVRCGSRIPGRYNDANALLALAILTELGFDPAVTAPAVMAATVPGRMERVDAGQDFLAVVDYSHKPAAVDGALRALRPLTAGRLIVVLGCGGDRDRAKRPVMGEVAARAADLLVITDDNPRSEDPAAIRAAMLAGALAVPPAERGEVREVGDRRDAIAAAVATAGPDDTVVVAGKGHERGQEINGRTFPFDDRAVLAAALRDALTDRDRR